MKKETYIKMAISIMILGSIVLLLFAFYLTDGPNAKSPKAVDGYLDLSNWNFTKGKIALLNGEWNFYPGQLLNPGELSGETAHFIKVPGSWKQSAEYTQTDRGNGTYRLFVKLPELQEPLVLKIQNIWMAHRLFINGKLVKEAGVPADSLKSYHPENTPYLVHLERGGEVELVIQVSNQVFYTGGISHPIQIGSKQYMETKDKLSFAGDMAEFLIFLLFGIYHLHMYQMRNKEPAYLYSGIFLIASSIAIAAMGEKLLMQLIDGIPFEAAYKIFDFFLFLSLPALALFIQALEPEVMKRRTLGIFLLPVFIYLGLVLFTPYHFYMAFKIGITFYADGFLLFYTVHFIYIIFHKERRKLPANESAYMVFCITFVGITILDSLLYYSGYINGSLISKLSMLGSLLYMNLFLARRFANKMNEVESLTAELIKANKIKDEFLARTSNELKVPLQGIVNISTHLLKEEPPSFTAEQKENLSLIRDTSAKLSFLVSNLINVIKLRHEDLQLKLITVDLHVVIQVVFQLLSFDLQGKKVRLLNQTGPRTLVEADESRLRQILYNISSNAVKYTEAGEITARAREEKGDIILTISDTGCGIPKEQWEQVFKDFNYDIQSDRQYKPGMGLGLYISRELARKMKGDVWIANSVVGKGTCLSLRLPKGQLLYGGTAPVPELAKKAFEPGHESSDINKNSKRILLVDDEPANIRVLSLLLEGEYLISAAYSGEEALRLLQDRKFDLLIADMMMPGMSGIELAKRIRQSHSLIELPIIIAIVRDEEREIELAYQNGANDYITKPFTEEEIQWRVRTLLKLTETMEKALKSEAAFLQAQIKPHFIYNALSNIIALCYEDGERAAELLSLLSRYLRYIFQRDQSQQKIPLEQELDIINTYVEIEKLRFGGRLHFKTYIDSIVKESKIQIPALLIQPLVENAIRHGLFNKQGDGTVYLSIMEAEGFIRIIVTDDGIGMSDTEVYQILKEKNGKGVGIKNIQQRIAALPKATFLIESELEKGTRCILFLPRR